MPDTFDALVLAGADPNRTDPLLLAHGVSNKALIEVGGRPMVARVVDALRASPCIRRIVVIGLDPEVAAALGLDVEACLLNHPSLFANISAGMDWLAKHGEPMRHALVTMADCPLLTSEAVTWFVDACRPWQSDIFWGIVNRTTMEALFPASARTYLKTRDGEFCSGDLFLVRVDTIVNKRPLVERLIQQRKHPFVQLRMVGIGLALRFMFGQLRLQHLIDRVRDLIGCQGAPIILPFAGSGMDVDKPHQLEQVQAYLQRSVGKSD